MFRRASLDLLAALCPYAFTGYGGRATVSGLVGGGSLRILGEEAMAFNSSFSWHVRSPTVCRGFWGLTVHSKQLEHPEKVDKRGIPALIILKAGFRV